MGMFDEVTFEYRMPDGYESQTGYQTKDLDCTLDEYTVTAEGRLIRTSCSGHRDDDGNENRPLVDLCFDGTVNIYDDDLLGRSGWHEYDLVFVKGSLVEIRCERPNCRLVFQPTTVGKLARG